MEKPQTRLQQRQNEHGYHCKDKMEKPSFRGGNRIGFVLLCRIHLLRILHLTGFLTVSSSLNIFHVDCIIKKEACLKAGNSGDFKHASFQMK
jgi:hypothetical protein